MRGGTRAGDRRVRRRSWQPGGGYDRNITRTAILRSMIEYLHANPVHRGLVARAEDWEWSSARWHAGTRPAPIEMDSMVLGELSLVLHAFQKKSKSGIKTPPQEIERVKRRLKEAERDYAQRAEIQKRQNQGGH